MKRIQVTDNFYLDELIDPVTYAARGERSLQLMDMRIILALQYLREIIGKPITVNTWARRGNLSLRGYRPEGTRTGAKWSQHKFGRALDFNVDGMTTREVHAVIMQHERYFIERGWITTIEDARDSPTWVHIDCRYTGLDKILVVRA
ncbi:MAG: hypothetical protein ACK505_12570 [Flavobacteriales bacterium]|jgi:hypothetical protein